MAKNCTCANGYTYSFPDGCDCYKCCANIGAGSVRTEATPILSRSNRPALGHRSRVNDNIRFTKIKNINRNIYNL